MKASGFIMQVEVLDTNMGKKRDFTDADRLKISSMLGYGKSTLERNSKKYESGPSNYEEIYGFRSNHEENAKRCHLRRNSQIKG